MSRDPVQVAYDALAPVYDDFTGNYQYERWTGRLLEKAEEAGLRGDALLDVACGTGWSFMPMIDRGFRVTGCDISEEMLAIARRKADGRANLLVADMRALPELGRFDLVWAVNDPLNYLLSVEELRETLAGFKRNLAATGIGLFDINTLVMYRTLWSSEVVVEHDGRRLIWQGRSLPDRVRPATVHEASFEVAGEARSEHVHRQRHFPEREVLAAIEAADLTCEGVYGEQEGDLFDGLDEETHTKAVYVCRPKS